MKNDNEDEARIWAWERIAQKILIFLAVIGFVLMVFHYYWTNDFVKVVS